jgi:hypothetical protein
LDEFLEECKSCFEALEKDFGKEAETEARCWYCEEIAKDETLMKSVAVKLAELCE